MRLRAPLTCAALLALACAAAQRESRLKRELDGYALPRPLAEVWPEALRVLDAHGFDLGSDDRVSIGKRPLTTASRFLSQARDTRSHDGRWIAETDLDMSDVRYRVVGTDVGGGACRVAYYRISGSLEGSDRVEHRDVDFELELVQRVEPDAAARLAEAARAR